MRWRAEARAVLQIDAGHPQRAAGRRQQAAEHAEGRGLAGAVRAEQAEDLAGLDGEADVVDGGERAELADEVADFDDGLAVVAPAFAAERQRERALPASVALCSSTMKPSSKRGLTAVASTPASAPPSALTSRTRPPCGTASVTSGSSSSRACRSARRLARRRRGEEGAPGRDLGDRLRRTLRQHRALVHDDRVLAALRLVQIGGADQHRQALVVDEMQDDLPQLAPRQRVDADRRLVEEQQVGGAHQRAGEAELLLHAAGEAPGEPVGERPERGHLHELRIDLRGAPPAVTPCRSA